jgi:hypothetical protein
MTATARKTRRQLLDVVLVAGIVILSLATAAIHFSLGGLLFTLNGIGFVVLAGAQLAPGRFFDLVRPLSRLALAGFSAATIVGWLLFGARFSLGYLATGIEVAILALVALALVVEYGAPATMVRRTRAALAEFRGQVLARI